MSRLACWWDLKGLETSLGGLLFFFACSVFFLNWLMDLEVFTATLQPAGDGWELHQQWIFS